MFSNHMFLQTLIVHANRKKAQATKQHLKNTITDKESIIDQEKKYSQEGINKCIDKYVQASMYRQIY